MTDIPVLLTVMSSATERAESSQESTGMFTSDHFSGAEHADRGDSEGEKLEDNVDGMFAPITARNSSYEERLRRHHSASSHPLERNWSLNDGYSIQNADEEAVAERVLSNKDEEASDTSEGFVVSWDDNDPMNPRNFNTVRRWLIVIICSAGSLCV